MPKIGLVTLSSSDDPAQNLPDTLELVRGAASAGADMVMTPEVTNCVSMSRRHQSQVLRHEGDDVTLRALQGAAKETGVWILIGSLALKTQDADGRFANRSFVIAADGDIRARYDKIHMFDVDVSPNETYRESEGYRPGKTAVIVQTDMGRLGLSICYDIRFAYLYRQLAQAGAEILTIPAAFTPVTGAAHWETLVRARAIETGCYVFAPAQTGTHNQSSGRARETHGHSLAVSPWGEVLYDGGDDVGFGVVDIDLAQVASARRRLPALQHDRNFRGPA